MGSAVRTAPTFQENLLSFGTCYGLALQGLGKSGIRTNLLPREILRDRLVKRKKPWAVAAAAAVMLACTVYYAAASLAWGTVDRDLWKQSESQASTLVGDKTRLMSGYNEAKAKFSSTDQIGQHLVGNVEGRIRWLEMLKAIDACLPSDAKRAGPSRTPPPAWRRLTRKNRTPRRKSPIKPS